MCISTDNKHICVAAVWIPFMFSSSVVRFGLESRLSIMWLFHFVRLSTVFFYPSETVSEVSRSNISHVPSKNDNHNFIRQKCCKHGFFFLFSSSFLSFRLIRCQMIINKWNIGLLDTFFSSCQMLWFHTKWPNWLERAQQIFFHKCKQSVSFCFVCVMVFKVFQPFQSISLNKSKGNKNISGKKSV